MILGKTKRRRIRVKNIIFSLLFIVLLVSMVSISFSWFTHSTQAVASGISINVVDAGNLVIKEGEGDWSHKLDILGSDSENSFKFQQVTGNGSAFYSPVQEKYVVEGAPEGYVYENYKITGIEPISSQDVSKYVYVYDFSAMIEQESDMYLADCYATGKGASVLRMALFIKNSQGDYENVLIWIPDVVTKLNDDGTVVTDDPESVVYFHNENAEKYGIDIVESAGVTVYDGIKYVWGNIPYGEHKVATLLSNTSVDLRIVLWTEGDDRDCRDYVSLGDVSIKLDFTAIEKMAE